MDQKLILINGNKGSGRKTVGELLYRNLQNASWIHHSWLNCCKNAEIERIKKEELFFTHLPLILNKYINCRIENIIVTGGIHTQEQFDLIIKTLPSCIVPKYFWLNIDDDIRSQRLVSRGRDVEDSLNSVARIIQDETLLPPKLQVANNQFYSFNSNIGAESLMTQIIKAL